MSHAIARDRALLTLTQHHNTPQYTVAQLVGVVALCEDSTSPCTKYLSSDFYSQN
jgi:hypothetical protein